MIHHIVILFIYFVSAGRSRLCYCNQLAMCLRGGQRLYTMSLYQGARLQGSHCVEHCLSQKRKGQRCAAPWLLRASSWKDQTSSTFIPPAKDILRPWRPKWGGLPRVSHACSVSQFPGITSMGQGKPNVAQQGGGEYQNHLYSCACPSLLPLSSMAP